MAIRASVVMYTFIYRVGNGELEEFTGCKKWFCKKIKLDPTSFIRMNKVTPFTIPSKKKYGLVVREEVTVEQMIEQ